MRMRSRFDGGLGKSFWKSHNAMGADVDDPPFCFQRPNYAPYSTWIQFENQLSLGTLSESFSNERIDPEVADLGVNTIGDRIRLRELCKSYVSDQRQADEADENAAASCATNSYRARKEPLIPTQQH